MVNLQDTPSAGLISSADLDAARKHSTGNVWLMPRRVQIAGRDTCTGQCETASGCDCAPAIVPPQPAEACTELGANAAESMWHHRRTESTVRWGFSLAALLAVAGYIVRAVWPL